MRYRIGCFLAFIGLITLLVFWATDQARNPAISLLCLGLSGIGSGTLMMWRSREQPPPSGRFSTMKKLQEKQKSKKQARSGDQKGAS